MKFNIEVDLDYIDEDGCLDDSIKESILSSVTTIVMQKVSKQVDAKLDEIIIKAATDKADKIVANITEDFMTQEFTKTDNYGDAVETGLTIKDLLKRRFNEFWKRRVDKQGNTSNYGESKTVIEWSIDKLIEKRAADFTYNLTKDTENKIKAKMKESLANSIGAKLVSELDFDKLLLEDKSKS